MLAYVSLAAGSRGRFSLSLELKILDYDLRRRCLFFMATRMNALRGLRLPSKLTCFFFFAANSRYRHTLSKEPTGASERERGAFGSLYRLQSSTRL